MTDTAVMEATAAGCSALRKNGLKAWVCFDHRLGARSIIENTGACTEFLIINSAGSSYFDNPSSFRENEVEIKNGMFNFRLKYDPARNYHMLSEVAFRFKPERLEKVFSYLKNEKGEIVSDSLTDITEHAGFFVNNSEYLYMDVFGNWEPPSKGKWYALIIPAFSSDYPDTANPKFRKYFNKQLEILQNYTTEVDGITWDEPGYCTSFESDKSRFPVSGSIYNMFGREFGYSLKDKLYALIRDTDNGESVKVRCDYYDILMESVYGAQSELKIKMASLFGEECDMGIHHTWHQNASDLVHGTMDWWRGSKALSGGFADVGGAERLYSQFDATNVFGTTLIAKSIAKFHENGTAYNNLWGVDYGYPDSVYPGDVMDYWVDLMGAYSVKWIPHIYGPTGYFEYEDISWGPGYPDHPTWDRFINLNKDINKYEKATGLIPPEANIAVVFPVNTMAGIGNKSAIAVSDEQFLLMYKLMLENYQADMISPELLASGKLVDGLLEIKGRKYETLIYPFPSVLLNGEWELIKKLYQEGFSTVLYGPPPEHTTGGVRVLDSFCELTGASASPLNEYQQLYDLNIDDSAFSLQPMTEWDSPSWSGKIVIKKNFRYLPFPLGQIKEYSKIFSLLELPVLIKAPENCIATVRENGSDSVITTCPAGYRMKYGGKLVYGDITIDIEQSTRLKAYSVSKNGKVKKLI